MSLLSKGLRGLGRLGSQIIKTPAARAIIGASPVGRVIGAAAAVGSAVGGLYGAARGRTAPSAPILNPTPINPEWEVSPYETNPLYGQGVPIQPGVGLTADQVKMRQALEAAGLNPDTGLPPGQTSARPQTSVLTMPTQQMGVGRAVTRVAAPAIGVAARGAARAIGKVKNTKYGKVIVTVGGYWIFDQVAGWIFQEGDPPRKSPRMNVLNPSALRRANRRVCGFASFARPVLRELGYQVSTTRKASRGCKPKKRGCK